MANYEINKLKILSVNLVIMLVVASSCGNDSGKVLDKKPDKVSAVKSKESELSQTLSKLPVVTKFLTPFKENKRNSYRQFYKRCISTFGAHRDSYMRGHKHSGADIKGSLNEPVYPVGDGIVTDIHLAFPHRTIIVLHRLPEGRHIYSVYKHVEGVVVTIGDTVSKDRPIARLFNADELKKSKFGVCHLHFEIKHNVSDNGRASFTCFTREELDKYYYDPLEYMKKLMDK